MFLCPDDELVNFVMHGFFNPHGWGYGGLMNWGIPFGAGLGLSMLGMFSGMSMIGPWGYCGYPGTGYYGYSGWGRPGWGYWPFSEIGYPCFW